MPRILLAALLFSVNAHSANTVFDVNSSLVNAEKTITITINPSGQAIIGRDTFTVETLSPELHQRLWKSYMGTGRMIDRIIIKKDAEVAMGISDSIMTAIQKAQKDVLTEVCVQKNKKRFDELSARQQDKMKRQFPVLFQVNFE